MNELIFKNDSLTKLMTLKLKKNVNVRVTYRYETAREAKINGTTFAIKLSSYLDKNKKKSKIWHVGENRQKIDT